MVPRWIRIVPLMVAALTLGACANVLDSDDSDGSVESVQVTDSILDVPESISGSADAANAAVIGRSSVGDNGLTEIFALIPEYVAVADGARDFVADLTDDILAERAAVELSAGEPAQPLEDDGNYDAFQVQTSERYDYAITLFTDTEEPGFVVEYAVNGDGRARGRIRFEETEPYEGYAQLESRVAYDITFDGQTDPQTLTVRFFRDLTPLIETAEALQTDADADPLEAMDLGRPQTVALDVSYSQTAGRYAVSGYSYHPGIETGYEKGLLEWTELFNDADGADRNTYLFRTVTPVDDSGEEMGAKLELAFPADDADADAAADAWQDDNLGRFVTDFYLRALNDQIVSPDLSARDRSWWMIYLLDELPSVADYPHLPGGTANSNVSDLNEDSTNDYDRFQAWVEAMYTGIGGTEATVQAANSYHSELAARIDSDGAPGVDSVFRDDLEIIAGMAADERDVAFAAGEAAPFTSENLAALTAFFENDPATDNDTSLNQVAGWSYATADEIYRNSVGTESAREDFLTIIALPSLLDAVDAHGYQVSREELEAFVARETSDEGARALREEYAAAGYLVNPAFYDPATGFFATLDASFGAGGRMHVVSDTTGELVPTEDPADLARIRNLRGLDLDVLDELVPADERAYFDTWELTE